MKKCLDLNREYADPLADVGLLPHGAVGGGVVVAASDDVEAASIDPANDERAAREADAFFIDRQRVVHSAAFRRLQHKTQVFGAGESDHFRSRLTHTMEVAHWAMLLARGLGLSAALAEVVALAHDLGHPPFGHAGERALDACMASTTQGASGASAKVGFEHNAHTLRVVEYLEHPYPSFRGLNLTRAVRECLAKHSTRYDRPGAHPLRDGTPPPLEGEVVDLADRLAYGLHDLQDGLYAGLIEPGALSELSLWRDCFAGREADFSDWPANLRMTIDAIQGRLLQGILSVSAPAVMGESRAAAASDERIHLDPENEQAFNALEEFLLQTLYHHPDIQAMDQRGRDAITRLFAWYTADPNRLPIRFRLRVESLGAARVVADYIAGMTDRYCLDQAQQPTR